MCNLKTVDDLALLFDSFEVGKNTVIEDIIEHVSKANIKQYIQVIEQLRELSSNFSITISKYKSTADTYELKAQLASQLSSELDMQFTEKEHENFDVRISIGQQRVVLAIRLFAKPLHDREYVTHNYLGSLKPTISASLYKMACSKIKDKDKVQLVDNFCGSGTILCESFLQGAEVSGGDVSPEAVKMAGENLKAVGAKDFTLKIESAFSTDWDEAQFNLAISNPPWGEQLEVASMTELYEKSVREYKRILTDDAVLCFIVKKPDLLIKFIKSHFPKHRIESRTISFNGQQPTIVIAYL
ncbi:MAG: methyltransferase [Candidatus Dojkabacteria bacterium]|nr:MAG: methyltransferase [Candidatus Dojkabacteria bacterium]